VSCGSLNKPLNCVFVYFNVIVADVQLLDSIKKVRYYSGLLPHIRDKGKARSEHNRLMGGFSVAIW
jgi:hypothetical protein